MAAAVRPPSFLLLLLLLLGASRVALERFGMHLEGELCRGPCPTVEVVIEIDGMQLLLEGLADALAGRLIRCVADPQCHLQLYSS